MLIPLWVPWSFVAAAVVFAVVCLDERGKWARDLGRWAVALVVLVIAAAVTIDRVGVSDDELEAVVERVAAELDGDAGIGTEGRVRVLVEDRLGHEVEVHRVDDPEAESDRPRHLEITADDTAVACLELYDADATLAPVTQAYASAGACFD